MKKIFYSIISIVLVVFVGCTPSKQEQEKQKQQAVQDSIAAVEASKSPILKEFEKAKKNGEITLSTFLQIGCIADRIKSDYGENYFNFLLQCLKDYTKPISVLSPDEDHYYIDAMPSYNNAETYISIYYDNSNNSLNANIRIADYIVNTDGGFTLEEGSKWEVKWLEYDEFGDPIKDKVFIAVYNDDLNYMNSTYIAVMKGDENHVRFYYDLPWYPGRFDNNKILSIKIKNKNDGTVRELSNYKYNTKYCILSEEDSRYIKEMCDSNPQISFCIRYEVISYDWFPDSDDIEVCTIDFDNGLAYGLNNAIMAYFYRVF